MDEVSIDAMGCQKKIADKILEKEGDFFFSLKGNQSSLHEDVKEYFQDPIHTEKAEVFEEYDKGHGRIETRTSHVERNIDWLVERHKNWPSIRTIVRIDSIRETGDKTQAETRYFISSKDLTAQEALTASRAHWGIENGNHLILDVAFNEDASQIAQGNAPENIGRRLGV